MLLIDFGGVLTTDVFDSFAAFCEAEGLSSDRFRRLLEDDREARDALVAIETGAIGESEFESRFAPLLGPTVEPDGLLARLGAGIKPEPTMLSIVEELREMGVVTVLVSNSFGVAAYKSYELERRFDHLVISGEVRVRKPSRAIFDHALIAAGCDARSAVFVDDLPHNVAGAERAGITGYVHRAAPATVEWLRSAFRR